MTRMYIYIATHCARGIYENRRANHEHAQLIVIPGGDILMSAKHRFKTYRAECGSLFKKQVNLIQASAIFLRISSVVHA